ncbi:MAG: leucine-rich repeat domain-containing protein [Tannerellaceae bacterium]|jgi:hypothetical protein|nr:leucine-rich repeat domain-containing protein [Tannerellaceae bacterium]
MEQHDLPNSGTTGSIAWSFSDGTLTLSGEGALPALHTGRPWDHLREEMRTVIVGQGMTTISSFAFHSYLRITAIVLPDSLTCIEEYAFANCRSLASLSLPPGLTRIGSHAFSACFALESLALPEGLKRTGQFAFSHCRGLTSLAFPRSLRRIEEGAFYGCTALESVCIPRGVTRIENRAFAQCSRLREATVEEGSRSYMSEDGVLFRYDGSRLTLYPAGRQESHYRVPDGVECIERGAFASCEALASLSLPQSLTEIDEMAFEDCRHLASILLPSGVEQVGVHAFHGCIRLESIPVEEGEGVYSSQDGILFRDGKELICCPEGKASADCHIPAGTLSIADYAFAHCTRLKSVGLPYGLTWIGKGAFYGCEGLTSILIPRSVQRIGEDAFYDCSGLQDLTVRWEVPLTADTDYLLFGRSVIRTCRLHVPFGTEELYRNAWAWEDFEQIMEEEDPDESI